MDMPQIANGSLRRNALMCPNDTMALSETAVRRLRRKAWEVSSNSLLDHNRPTFCFLSLHIAADLRWGGHRMQDSANLIDGAFGGFVLPCQYNQLVRRSGELDGEHRLLWAVLEDVSMPL